MIDIIVPSPGESILEVQIAAWLVEDGAFVEKDQDIVEVDSDKATLSIPATENGKIKLLAQEGDTIEVGAVIASIDTSVKGEQKAKNQSQKLSNLKQKLQKKNQQPATGDQQPVPTATGNQRPASVKHFPLAKKLMHENNVSEAEFINFMKGFRVGKKDVDFFLSEKKNIPSAASTSWGGTRDSDRKKMSTLRLKLAERLVSVKNETAMLTTFNEVNMTPIMEIRKKYKEIFKEKHGVSLGFMSFFTKAVTEALNIVPGVNAQIDGNEVVYHNYADIGIAVSSPKGLMVPILRNAEQMSLAEIEWNIKELAIKARSNKITIDEMLGGTFTITNGGVFGSMLSTPIINPPQSAILGMHNIVERPIAVNGKVEIHPMMYVAVSYDHRIIDGKESVTFLVNVKEMLENPAKMLTGGKEPAEKLLGL
ncbi:MAG: 2-oxoglutarate dehydrogenase complex dihydrolipoyllysine-residue succinyltransferase [Bacteroidales bacterium]